MNKQIILTNNGGFPLVQDTLKFMQESFSGAFMALAKLLGDKVILYGVEVAGGNVSAGWIAYNGELIPFVGGAAGDKVSIETTTNQALFEDSVYRDAYVTKYAICGPVGDFDFADLKNIGTLATIFQDLADVIAAFGAHNHSYDNLTNLPVAKIVAKGSAVIGDVANDKIVTINIPLQADTNYQIIGTLVGQNSNLDVDNDVMFIVGAKTNNSFKIAIKETTDAAGAGNIQNLKFDYFILR